MPTDTKPFYHHILGTHWEDKPNKGLDVKVKKKKSAIFFESQAASHKHAAVRLNSGTGSAETSEIGALCPHRNRLAVVPSQCMGVHVNGSSQHINTALLPAIHQIWLTGAKRETSDQGSVRQYPHGGGKKCTQKDSSIRAHALLGGLTCMDTSPKATPVTRRFKHRRKRRWRDYTFAHNRWGRQSEVLLHYAR